MIECDPWNIPVDSYGLKWTVEYGWIVTWHEYGIHHAHHSPYGIYHRQHVETLPAQWQPIVT